MSALCMYEEDLCSIHSHLCVYVGVVCTGSVCSGRDLSMLFSLWSFPPYWGNHTSNTMLQVTFSFFRIFISMLFSYNCLKTTVTKIPPTPHVCETKLFALEILAGLCGSFFLGAPGYVCVCLVPCQPCCCMAWTKELCTFHRVLCKQY